MKAMVITVGTGRDRKDLAGAIIFSIKQSHPDYIHFLVTDKSKEETLGLILEEISSLKIDYSTYISKNENNVLTLIDEYIKEISKLKNKNYTDIVVDYTSGTKPMSSAVVIAGIYHEISSLIYIMGDRDKDGRVITGTENISILRMNKLYAEKLLEEGIKFFNDEKFHSSLESVEKIKEVNYGDREFTEKLGVIAQLFDAYYRWDIFDLDGCFNLLKGINKDFLETLGVREEVEKNKQFLYREIQNPFCEERAIDLFLNAMRRAREKKYDDAVARLYRICEFLFQREIASFGLYKDNDTDKLDLDKLPPELKKEYELKVRNGRLPLGLEGTIELLKKLGSDSIKKVEQNLSFLRKVTPLRNKSILAHGFGHISENGYKKYLEFVKNIADKLISDFEKKCNEFKFPKISTE